MNKDPSFRSSFQCFPPTGHTELGLPIGGIYKPMTPLAIQPISYQPVFCATCQGILNPYSEIDFTRKSWKCPICNSHNPLPILYHGMTPENLALELFPQNTTVEYTLEENPLYPVYLFVVDTCVGIDREFEAMKCMLTELMATIPENSYVGFISYGTIVYLHETAISDKTREYVFNGKKTYTPLEIQKMLKINAQTSSNSNKFITPFSTAEQMLNNIVEQLEKDSFDVPKGKRHERCTGAALELAVSLLEILFPVAGGHIILLANGPATRGPGAIASLDRKEFVRQIADVEKGCQTSKTAQAFYKDLGKRCAIHNIAVSFVSSSFEESGFFELESVVSLTGGFSIIGESWVNDAAKDTILKYFSTTAALCGSHAKVVAIPGAGLQVAGMVGPGTSLARTGPYALEGSSNQWALCEMRPDTSLAVLLAPKPSFAGSFLQLQTRYSANITGRTALRVTTVALGASVAIDAIAAGFDQEVAMALIGKAAIERAEASGIRAALDFIDAAVVAFAKKFRIGGQLPQCASGVLQLAYNLRRSKCFMTANSTPDLMAFARNEFKSADTDVCALITVPTLVQYSLAAEPTPVYLSEAALVPDTILVLDSYSKVVVWSGRTVAQWRTAGYHEQEGHENLKELMEKSFHDAELLCSERFPVPLLITCDQDSSLERFLRSKLAQCVYPVPPNVSKITLDTPNQTFDEFEKRLFSLA